MAEKNKYSIKTDFTLLALLLIPIAVAVNFAGGQLAIVLKLPFYLDTIGTILIAMLCGPWVGAIAGLVSNLVLGVADPVYFPYAVVNVAVGLIAGFCARKGGFTISGGIGSYWWKWAVSIVLVTLVSVIIDVPITVLVFGGITSSGISLITAALLATGTDLWAAVTGTQLVFTGIDRIISVIFTLLVVMVMPSRTLIKFPLGEMYIKDAGAAQTEADDEE